MHRTDLRPTRRSSRGDLSTRLDREWGALRRDPRALTAVGRWGLRDRPFVDLDEVLDAVGYRQTPVAAHNDLLHALTDQARTDDLAARIVLQRMLPGLLADVRRRGGFGRGTAGLFEELLANAWITIRVAHIDPTSACVAGTLVRDACYRTFRAPLRRRVVDEVSVDPGSFTDQPAPADQTALEELAEVVGEARARGLGADDVELVRALVRAESPGEVARDRQVTPRTVRNHRDRAVHEIRRLTDAVPAA